MASREKHPKNTKILLVGGLEHFLFFHLLRIIIPSDFHIFQRGRYTTNQWWLFDIFSTQGQYVPWSRFNTLYGLRKGGIWGDSYYILSLNASYLWWKWLALKVVDSKSSKQNIRICGVPASHKEAWLFSMDVAISVMLYAWQETNWSSESQLLGILWWFPYNSR